MLKRILLIAAALLVAATALCSCSGGADKKEAEPSKTAETVQAAEASISEDDALSVALDDAGITKTAAEDLEVKSDTADGKAVYVITFKWSGFDYEYTIDGADGTIVKKIFDGDQLIPKE